MREEKKELMRPLFCRGTGLVLERIAEVGVVASSGTWSSKLPPLMTAPSLIGAQCARARTQHLYGESSNSRQQS